MTDLPTHLRTFFQDEIAKGQPGQLQGEVFPATLESAIDSLSRGAGVVDEGWTRDDYIAFLLLVAQSGGEARLSDIED